MLVIGNANQCVEIGWYLRFKREHFAAEGVFEADRPGMKGQTLLGAGCFSILPVADNRVPDAGQMNPYLMLPAREQINLQQSAAPGLLEHFIRRMRQHAVDAVGSRVHVVSFRFCQVCRNRIRAFFAGAVHDSQILLLRCVPLALQAELGIHGFGEDEYTGCFPVEAVNDENVLMRGGAPLTDIIG